MRPSLRVLVFAATIVVALAAAAGATYALTRPGTVTTSNQDVYRVTTANKDLSVGAHTNTTILSFYLPAGNWVVSASAEAIQRSAKGWVRCGVYDGSTALDTQAGNLDVAVSASMNPVSAIKASAPFTVSLQCADDNSALSINYIDAGATLWAHKSVSLNTH